MCAYVCVCVCTVCRVYTCMCVRPCMCMYMRADVCVCVILTQDEVPLATVVRADDITRLRMIADTETKAK